MGLMSELALTATTVTCDAVKPWVDESRLRLPVARFAKVDFLITLGLLGDLSVILAGLALGYWIRFESGWIWMGKIVKGVSLADYFGLISLGAVFLLLTFGYLQLYQPRRILSYRDTAQIVFKGLAFWACAFLSISLVLKFQPDISRIYVVISCLACLVLLLAWRWAFHRLVKSRSLARSLRQRVLVVGWTPEAERMCEAIAQDPSQPYEVVGWVSSLLERREFLPPRNIPELGDSRELPHVMAEYEVDIVILADLSLDYEAITELANLCEKQLVHFKIIPSYFQILLSGLKLEPVSGVPVLGVSELPLDRTINRFLKRCVDMVGASVGLALSVPIMLICGVLIYLESPGPIFFAQERLGRNGKRFKMYKLRSMRPNASDTDHVNQSTLREDPRVLRIGQFIRQWNLDEVPQFWNVLKGEMSLVGPRPERVYHSIKLSESIPHYNARLASKPGLTGWAQVNGLRGDTSLVERVRYDLYYLENWTLWFDLQTMVMTFFRRQNAY